MRAIIAAVVLLIGGFACWSYPQGTAPNGATRGISYKGRPVSDIDCGWGPYIQCGYEDGKLYIGSPYYSASIEPACARKKPNGSEEIGSCKEIQQEIWDEQKTSK